jgi:hypothetical protein
MKEDCRHCDLQEKPWQREHIGKEARRAYFLPAPIEQIFITLVQTETYANGESGLS